jgi:NADP-dependent 3-hydroxy acid dehydrogenase YdfG
MSSDEKKTVLITGASGAAGQAAAKRFAAEGYALALSGRDLDKLQALADEIGAADGRFLLLTGDVTTLDGANAAVQGTLDRFGRLDVLVNLVGGWTGGKGVVETPLADIETMLNQHFYSTLHLSRAVLPGMLERGWGRIMVVTSPVAGSPAASSLAYAVGKAAQETVILAVADQVKGSGVTANAMRVRAIDAKYEKVESPTSKNAFWSTPDEIAEVMWFLCSEVGGMINGARLPLYGSG